MGGLYQCVVPGIRTPKPRKKPAAKLMGNSKTKPHNGLLEKVVLGNGKRWDLDRF